MSVSLNYDGAPRPITIIEARTIASDEYTIRGSRGSWFGMSGGADGGMHVRADFARLDDARAWLDERRAGMVARIMAGECQHTIFYLNHRDIFYCA